MNYENGKIYKIVGDTGITYYGSTTLSLKRRMQKHRSQIDTSAYRDIISQMDCEIILVENYPCESKKELELRESKYIRENPCVNHVIPGRTMKEWEQDNRERLSANHKKYYQENREKNREKMKKYHADHREERNATAKKRGKWTRSFGDPRYTNNLQRCDPSLFH